MTHRPPPPSSRRVPRADDPGPPPPAPRADDVLTASEARLDLTRAYDRLGRLGPGVPYVTVHRRHQAPLRVVLDGGNLWVEASDAPPSLDPGDGPTLDVSRDEAVELARALLVLAYHRDRAVAADRITGRVVDRLAAHERDADRAALAEAFHRHRTGDLRTAVTAELAADLPPPPPRHCDAHARRGTGTGVCDRPLDRHGGCDRAADHVGDGLP